VAGARALGRRVIDRCNLTVFFEPGQEDTPEFLAEQGVEIVASLPCHTADTVERQRGRGVFDGSIRALQKLNSLGYGGPGTGLRLNLVYNPVGAFLPPEQQSLEALYREQLRDDFGIEFGSLLTITNMPIKRFAHELRRDGKHQEYMSLLIRRFNPATLPELMCRELLSVDWRGRLFDCDFNQALDRPLPGDPVSIFELENLDGFEGKRIATDEHCFGCTAGSGSSCGGALAE
jgi:radical SAM/Cys-rich protein